MGFSRQEYWSGLSFPSPGDLLGPGVKPVVFLSPALADGFFTTSATWEAPVDMEWYVTVFLICIVLMANDVEYLFMCLFAFHISSLQRSLFTSSVHSLIMLSFYYWAISVLCILWIQVSYQIHDLQIFSPILSFVFLLYWCAL